MSMDVGAKGSLKADINVTPLVDVMLVLLIIMMLIAPMLQKGVDVRLPQASNSADKPENQEQTVVAIDANKMLYLNSARVREDDLVQKLTEALESQEREDRPHQGRCRCAVLDRHGDHGQASPGSDRERGSDHRAQDGHGGRKIA